MTKIMYVGKDEVVDIPTLGEQSPGRIARGQGADIDPALADELLKGKNWEPARESYVPVVMTQAQAEAAERETAHLKLAAEKAKAYDPQASVKAFAESGGQTQADVAHATTPVIDPAPPGAPGTPEAVAAIPVAAIPVAETATAKPANVETAANPQG